MKPGSLEVYSDSRNRAVEKGTTYIYPDRSEHSGSTKENQVPVFIMEVRPVLAVSLSYCSTLNATS